MATFNILHGRSVHDGAVELGRLEESIRRLDADVLALQEVDLDQPRSAMADLTALAAQAMGAVTHRFVAAISGTPGATWMAATGREQPGTAAYGIALLSRFPVQSWQVVRLPRIPMTFPMYLREPNKVLMVHEEPRAAMVARLDTPLGPMTVANTHLSFVPGWNRVQLRHSRPRSARLPRTTGADGRPQHDTAEDEALGRDALAVRRGHLSRGPPAASARPHPHRRSGAAGSRVSDARVADLGSSGARCGRFAAVTT